MERISLLDFFELSHLTVSKIFLLYTSQMKLDHRLKLGWFGLLGALAFQGRFIALFFRDRGFTNSEIGFILGSNPVISAIATPIFSYLSDRTSTRKVLTMLISASVFMVAIYGLASMLKDTAKFITFFLAYFMFSVSYSPTMTIFDAATLVMLKVNGEDTKSYGDSRLYGAVSWGVISAFIIGPLIDVFKDTWILVIGFCVSASILAVTMYFIVLPSDEKMKSKRNTLNEVQRQQDTSSVAVSSSTINRLVKIFTADRWTRTISFYFFVFCLSIGTSLIERLIFLYFSEDLGASNFLCGLSVLITVAFEIPLFYYSKYIMNRVSLHNMNVIAAVAYCVRVVTYTLINSDSQWLLLSVEPLHGVTFALHKLSCLHYISSIAPTGLEASAQSVLSVVQSLGSATGVLCGGVIIDRYGSDVLYRSAATLIMIATAVYYYFAVFTSTTIPSGSSKNGDGGGGFELLKTNEEEDDLTVEGSNDDKFVISDDI